MRQPPGGVKDGGGPEAGMAAAGAPGAGVVPPWRLPWRLALTTAAPARIMSRMTRPRLRHGTAVRLYGARNRSYRVTAGVIDVWAVDAYTRGQCHALAQALAARTGWPILVFGDAACASARGRSAADCAPYPGVCACQPAHMGVVLPDGRFLDIRGARPMDEVLRDTRMAPLGIASTALLAAIGCDLDRWPLADLPVADLFAAALLAGLDAGAGGAVAARA
jgi:hypothetical protein